MPGPRIAAQARDERPGLHEGQARGCRARARFRREQVGGERSRMPGPRIAAQARDERPGLHEGQARGCRARARFRREQVGGERSRDGSAPRFERGDGDRTLQKPRALRVKLCPHREARARDERARDAACRGGVVARRDGEGFRRRGVSKAKGSSESRGSTDEPR